MRFWFIGIAFAALGCTGQHIEGRWKGSLPYAEARDCRIQIFSDGGFNLVCSQNAWVGAGRYDYDGKHLILRYKVMTHHGAVQTRFPNLECDVVGKGNQLDLTTSADEQFGWVRVLDGK